MEQIQRAYDTLRPQLPTLSVYASIVLSALFPIYTGAHASMSRPASAAPPKKEKEDGDLEEEEEEETVEPMESLTASDAILFPIVAACVLATLYWLIERYGAEIINLIMSWYLAGAGVFSVIKLLSDGTHLLAGFIFPSVYGYDGKLWRVDMTAAGSTFKTKRKNKTEERSSPYPGLLGALSLPSFALQSAWTICSIFKQKYAIEVFVKEIINAKARITAIDAIATVFGVMAVVYSNFVHNFWWLTNLQGFAVSYFALQMLSPTSFAIGSLVLCGLFFYDIWAVFFTPLMVTVATKLDQPIKLVFPRHDLREEEKALQYSMLGLGDIVLPGLMIGLCLRYDLYMFWLRKQTTKKASSSSDGPEVVKAPYTSPRGHWSTRFWTSGLSKDMVPSSVQNASFPKPYFYASLMGYTVGLSATLGVMVVFDHAQPALLYLVPSVLTCVWGTGLIRGELKQMWQYSEALTGDPVEGSSSSSANEVKVKVAEPKSWWASLSTMVFGGSDNESSKAGEAIVAETAKTSNDKDARAKADEIDINQIIKINVSRIPLISGVLSSHKTTEEISQSRAETRRTRTTSAVGSAETISAPANSRRVLRSQKAT